METLAKGNNPQPEQKEENKKLAWQNYYTPEFIPAANDFKLADVIARAKAAT